MQINKATTLLFSTCLAAAFSATAFAQPVSDPQAGDPPAADNTKINQRDKAPGAVTASDQPNDSANTKLAASVRSVIVGDETLSTTAQNVKLVAADGVVTLRGPVNSDAEKARIGRIVARVSGVSSVDNQLDVKYQ